MDLDDVALVVACERKVAENDGGLLLRRGSAVRSEHGMGEERRAQAAPARRAGESGGAR